MDNTRFFERLERINSDKVEEKAKIAVQKKAPPYRFAIVPVGAIAAFFVLKAAALVTNGVPFAAPVTSNAPVTSRVFHWFAGADPVTVALANSLRPTPTHQIRTASLREPIQAPATPINPALALAMSRLARN